MRIVYESTKLSLTCPGSKKVRTNILLAIQPYYLLNYFLTVFYGTIIDSI